VTTARFLLDPSVDSLSKTYAMMATPLALPIGRICLASIPVPSNTSRKPTNASTAIPNPRKARRIVGGSPGG
jgi:hypothetical protein